MKRSLFAFSLLALLFTGFASVRAQSVATPTQKPMTPYEAYTQNFTKALNEGNVTMADPHRQKLCSSMQRDIQIAESATKAPTAKPSKADAAATKDLTRQREILEVFRTMDLSTPAALEAAKSKLSLIDEFGKITTERAKAAATN